MPELAVRLLAEKAETVHPAPLSRFCACKSSALKRTLLAIETDRADVVRARRVWAEHRQSRIKERRERLIFIDETGTTALLGISCVGEHNGSEIDPICSNAKKL
jgi:hypothetical protein